MFFLSHLELGVRKCRGTHFNFGLTWVLTNRERTRNALQNIVVELLADKSFMSYCKYIRIIGKSFNSLVTKSSGLC
jgi:hypothetical protein